VLVEPAAPVVEPSVTEAAVAGAPVVEAPVTGAPAVTTTPAAETAPPVVAPTASPAPPQIVYVAPPVPPKKRGNRLIGVLLAIAGTVFFAALYGVVSAFIIDLRSGDLFGPTFISFLGSAFFWVPGVVFLVAMVLLVLILNRAGWWAHVLGSLVLAVAVYFGMIGVLLFIGNTLHSSPRPISFAELAVNPWVLAAAVVARELSIWTGLGIAARGRRVAARNAEAQAAFVREQEQKRAENVAAATPATAA
jgi:hypothetical protein